MTWNWTVIIFWVSTAIAIFSWYSIFTGETKVVQLQELNEITGEYEPRYEEVNVNIIYMIPCIIFSILSITSVFRIVLDV